MDEQLIRNAVRHLFTMTMVFDRDFTIQTCSERLAMRCPLVRPGANLHDIYKFHRPRGIKRFEELYDHAESLILLTGHDNEFALRGQIVLPLGNESEWAVFLGAPWMSWVLDNSPDLDLELADFPKHDAQLDHSFYMSSQKAVVEDLGEVNKQLREARDAARKAEKIRSHFFTVMSHEMRTPLNGVISSLNLIEEEEDPKVRDKLLEVTQTSAENLLSVINYVLDYSKLEAGKVSVESTVFDLHACIGSITDILHAKAIAKGISIKKHIDRECPRWVKGDEGKLRQVLINLASNAVKFTDHGTVTVGVHCSAEQNGQAQFLFEVIDSGIGIAEADQQKIFEPFWSVSAIGSKRDQGTGLGLNICARMVELLHGTIALDSELSKGSRFTVSIPLEIAEPQSTIIEIEKPANSRNRRFNGTILLVDDNQTNLLVGEMILNKMGLQVRVAKDGFEAVQIAAYEPFDLILMDITMPQMMGTEATIRLREQGIRTPIVALTAHTEEVSRREFLGSGMQDVLHKPIDQVALADVLEQWLPVQSETRKSIEKENGDGITSLIDEKMLNNLIEAIGEENLGAAFDLFEKESSTLMQKIINSGQRKDFLALRNESHTLKSSAASFGVAELASKLKDIELAASKKEIDNLSQMLASVEKVYVDSVTLLKSRFKQ